MRCRSICRCSPAAARRVCGLRYACRIAWAPAAGSAWRGCARHRERCVYGLIEPACLLGPFGQVNPALKPIWLDRVMESKSILSFGDNQYAPMLAFVAFVVAGIVAQFAIWRARPTTSNALATAMIVLAAMLGCWQIKLMLYASWLAVLPLAVFAARLERLGSLTAPAAGVCVVLLLNQSTLAGVFEAGEVVVRTVVGAPVAEADEPEVGKECARTSNIARLADLPPGLVAANIDLGPHIVAMTPHRVVAAPYHRLDKGILAGHAILHGTPEEAERVVRALGVSYIVLCGATKRCRRQAGVGREVSGLAARPPDAR